ncbi:hypothetical protein ACFPZI_33750, partial [Streptomyces chlorus]
SPRYGMSSHRCETAGNITYRTLTPHLTRLLAHQQVFVASPLPVRVRRTADGGLTLRVTSEVTNASLSTATAGSVVRQA